MSKQIKLDDQVYHRLDAIRVGRETFSHAVERLLDLYKAFEGLQSEFIKRGHASLREEGERVKWE